MKKRDFRALFVLFILVAFIFSIAHAKAIDLGGAQQGIEQVKQVGKTLTEKEASQAYLKEKWTAFIKNTWMGKFLVIVTPYIKLFDPVFKIVLGTGFEWSWVFILSFALAYSIVFFFKRIVSIFTATFRARYKFLDYGIPLILMIALSMIGLTNLIARGIVNLINAWFETLLMQIIAGIIVIFGFVYIFTFSGMAKRIADAIKERYEKLMEKQKLEKTAEDVKKIKLKLETGKKGKGGKEVEVPEEEQGPDETAY